LYVPFVLARDHLGKLEMEKLDAAATSSKQNCFFMTDGSEMPWADE
jgi:hypothetical protein